MTQPETKVKKKIKEKVQDEFPSAWGYMPVQMGYGEHGIPDHVYCIPLTITPDMVGDTVGLFVGIEAKTAQGRMSKYQTMQKERILKADGIYLTVYGINDIDDKIGLLTEVFKR